MPSSPNSTSASGGTAPASASCSEFSTSTIWKVSCAVWPMTRSSWVGSLSPGAWTTMRSAPWRVIEGSRVPRLSMRRRTTSIDCSTAVGPIWARAWSV